MHRLAIKCTGKTSRARRKRERELFETDNHACAGRIAFCYSLTSWTFVSHAWVDWVWVHS